MKIIEEKTCNDPPMCDYGGVNEATNQTATGGGNAPRVIYRRLQTGETIENGDQYSTDGGKTWNLSEAAGYGVRAGDGTYRRAVQSYRDKERNQWTPTDVAEAIKDGVYSRPLFGRGQVAPLVEAGREVIRVDATRSTVTVRRYFRKNERPHANEPDEASRLERCVAALQGLVDAKENQMETAAEWDEAREALKGLN